MIHNFTGAGDGANPEAGVSIRAGSLYGTAYNGGNGYGTAYEVIRLGNNWGTVPIYLFPPGSHPRARLVFGPDGHPYGSTAYNGINNSGYGIVFNLIVPLTICKTANCFWTENVVHQFSDNGVDGANPGYGDLTWDLQGKNFYGTTVAGGLGPAQGFGTAYEVQPVGNHWTEAPIYEFAGAPDGASPQNGVIVDSTGNNLFGTTLNGGLFNNCSNNNANCGTVFQLTFIPGVGWTEPLPPLYSFQNGSDGSLPVAGLIFDSTRTNLYGATSDGGMGGGGTVFELSPSGDTWTFKLLYSFSGPPGQQCGPRATLTMDTAGNLYGTTYCDGATFGSVFKLTNTGNGWTYTSLHDFTGGNDGANPISNVTIDTNGNLYGTASKGGSLSDGVVWQITP